MLNKKQNPKNKSIISIVLGIVGIMLFTFMVIIPGAPLIAIATLIAGLIIGIKGLKSSKKLARLGILVCVIGLIYVIYFSFVGILLLIGGGP